VPDLELAFGIIRDAVKARLLVQGPLREIVGPIAFDYWADKIGNVDFALAFERVGESAAPLASIPIKLSYLKPALDALAFVMADAEP
jgi:hypothetical protein